MPPSFTKLVGAAAALEALGTVCTAAGLVAGAGGLGGSAGAAQQANARRAGDK
jgi:hypothetical protein